MSVGGAEGFSLATFLLDGRETAGLVLRQVIFPLPDLVERWGMVENAVRGRTSLGAQPPEGLPLEPTVLDLLERWDRSLPWLRGAAARLTVDPGLESGIPLSKASLLAPVPRPGKMINVGLNYRDHAEEMGIVLPDDGFIPNFFFKGGADCIVGPSQSIALSSAHVDWEAEVALVIGSDCREVGVDEALDHVAGYTCHNDVSDRGLMFRGDGSLDFLAGKARDTFGPLGPTLVPREYISDVGSLSVRCLVNGELMQDFTTAFMVWDAARCVSYLSHVFTLRPGDVIALGTGAGVGWAKGLPEGPRTMADVVAHFKAGGGTFLHSGDRVVVEVEGIGRLENEVA